LDTPNCVLCSLMTEAYSKSKWEASTNVSNSPYRAKIVPSK